MTRGRQRWRLYSLTTLFPFWRSCELTSVLQDRDVRSARWVGCPNSDFRLRSVTRGRQRWRIYSLPSLFPFWLSCKLSSMKNNFCNALCLLSFCVLYFFRFFFLSFLLSFLFVLFYYLAWKNAQIEIRSGFSHKLIALNSTQHAASFPFFLVWKTTTKQWTNTLSTRFQNGKTSLLSSFFFLNLLWP